ncbi:hypothetical protein ACFP3Q_04705 [Nocardioides sp. GCM10027113]|uniref:hypothetical protein n=1 Tax=unclassified Nocardioides TaxID=2615069 RepID=UPI00361542C0
MTARRVAHVALLLALALVAACTSGAEVPRPDRARPAADCWPVSFDDVRGRAPAYVDEQRLGRFRNDRAMCGGVWVGTRRGLVPQGLVVDGRTAWVSGYDGEARPGHKYCLLVRVDLRTGRATHRDPVSGQVGNRDPVTCRHAGGLAADDHGLWLVETGRVWLLDPGTLDVRRGWALAPPLRGSFAVTDDDGHLGIGSWHPRRRGSVHWFSTDLLVAGSVLDLTTGLAARSERAPSMTQGAVHADLDGRAARTWFARSVTRCGVLVDPAGHRLAFVPGAEGMALAEDGALWVASESGSRHYQRLGGRPLVPTLVRLDLDDLDDWRRPGCRP